MLLYMTVNLFKYLIVTKDMCMLELSLSYTTANSCTKSPTFTGLRVILSVIYHYIVFQVEVVEGVAGEEDHHDDQEEQGEENAEAEGQHDEHDEDGTQHSVLFPF